MAATDSIHSGTLATTEATISSDHRLARVWRARGFLGGLAAIGLAIWAQFELVGGGRPSTAGILYTVAIVLLLASMLELSLARRKSILGRDTQDNPQTEVVQSETTLPATGPPTDEASPSVAIAAPAALPTGSAMKRLADRVSSTGEIAAPRRRRRFTLLGATLTLLLAGAAAFVLLQSISNPLAGWLWAAALVMLLLTSINASIRPPAKSLLRSPANDFFARGLPAMPRRWEAVLVGGVLLISLGLRIIDLEYMPGIFGDEGERGMDARAINEGKPTLLFGYGWWGVPNLYFYLVSFMLRIFGDNMVGDRMLSVISGVVSVWFVYKIGRLLWGPRAGLIAGAMLAVSPLALQFSRLAGESTPTGALWASGAYYFFMALRHLRWRDWALSGMIWGFSLYFYAAGKLIIPVIGLIGLYCLVRWRRHLFKHYAAGFALLILTFGLTFMPYGIFSSQEQPPWQSFTGRAQETSIFSPWNQADAFARYGIRYDPAQSDNPLPQNILAQPLAWGQLFFEQMRTTTDVLYKRGDPTVFYQISEHNGSMLSPIWAAIALLGLVYGVWKFWDERYGILNIIFWGGTLGAALTIDTPSVQRLTNAWPFLMLFPAALLDRVFAAAWPLNMGLARKWATVPLTALLVFFAADSYREYFVHYASLCPYCDATTQARYAQTLGQDFKAYQMGVGAPLAFFSYGSTRFVAKGVEGADLAAAPDFFPITDNGDKGVAFLIYPHSYDYKPLIRMFYPGGEETSVKSSDGSERFTSYKVTRKQMSLFQTSHATYRSGDAVISRDEPNIGTLSADDAIWTLPVGVTYPVSATWQGGLVAPTYKAYTFYLEGSPDAHLEIDGHDFPPDPGAGTSNSQALRQVDVVLAKGMHQIRLSGTLDAPGRRLTLKWSDSKSMSPIKSAYLYNSNGRENVLGGLSGEVGPLSSPELLREADPFGGLQPETRRNDPFLGFREATVAFGEAPFLVRWRGNINITTPGDYIFSLRSQGPSIMLVDGRVAGGQGAAQSTVRVPFTAGSHAVDIRYAWGGGPAVIEWYWNTPGGNYGLVPTSVLTPAARSWLLDEMPDAPGAAERAGETATLEAVIGAEAGLTNPKGIAVDADGNLYVGDKGNGRIVALSPDGKVLHTWGKAGNEQNLQPGEFLDMQDVAISPDGIIAVTDYKSQIVQLFDKKGLFIGSLDATATQVAGANGVAWPTGRNIYIADTNVSKVLKLTLASDNSVQAVESVPVDEENKLEQVLDVAVDSTGTVYAVDVMNRILRISPDGAITVYRLPVGTSNGGSRLAVNLDGSKLYMSDPDRKRVAILDTVSENITYFGEGGSNPGQFGEPSGVAVGADGRIYVLDRLNNNIQVFLPPR